LKSSNAKGIRSYEVDLKTGVIKFLHEMQGIDSPSYIAIDHTNNYLYAISEVFEWQEGIVSAYSIDRATGKLTYINKQATSGSICAHLSVDSTDRFVLVANYGEGKGVVMLPIRSDGGVEPVCSSFEHVGAGPNIERQERSHVHCILPDPNNQFVFAADLGIDKLVSYFLDLKNGQLIANPANDFELVSGSGPRHFLFHPNGKFVFVINELDSTICAFSYTEGKLRMLQSISTLPKDFVGISHCSSIQITPNGKFLYGANRGHDSLAIYAVNQSSGLLILIGHQSTNGKTPRDFGIDPTGTFLLVANQDSDTIVTFRIEPVAGCLIELGVVANVPTPVCLKMFVV
jgi:6-phosphogluconolactonase